MGDNPRRYGFKESLDELSAMFHYAAQDGLTKRELDLAELFIQARSWCPAVFELPGGGPDGR